MNKKKMTAIVTELFLLISNKEVKKKITKITKNFDQIKTDLEQNFQKKSKTIKKLLKETHNIQIGSVQAKFTPSKMYKKIIKELDKAYAKGNAEINKILKTYKTDTKKKINKLMLVRKLVDNKMQSLIAELTKIPIKNNKKTVKSRRASCTSAKKKKKSNKKKLIKKKTAKKKKVRSKK